MPATTAEGLRLRERRVRSDGVVLHRLGLVGCGNWGSKLARVLSQNERVRLAAVTDSNLDRARSVASTFGVEEIPADLNGLLGLSLDAVVVATPPESHYEIGAAAIGAGLHILVEKPFTTSASSSRDLELLACRAGSVALCDHTFLHSPAVRYVRRAIEAGDLGRLSRATSLRMGWGRHRPDVDIVWNLAPHDVSILNYLLGGLPDTVACALAGRAEDATSALLELTYGSCVATVHLDVAYPAKLRQMTLLGSDVWILYDGLADPELKWGAWRPGDLEIGYQPLNQAAPRLPRVEPLSALIDHFVDCIEGAPDITRAGFNTDVVRVLEAATESRHENGVPVEVKAASATADEG